MRVVIADDSALLRAGIARVLTMYGSEVVEQVTDGDGLLAAYERHQPDVLVVDVRMPPTYTDEGIQAVLRLRAHYPDAPVLVLSQYVEERYAVDLLGSGAAGLGYLLKDRVADISDFIRQLETVAAGGTVLDPEIVEQLRARGLVASGR